MNVQVIDLHRLYDVSDSVSFFVQDVHVSVIRDVLSVDFGSVSGSHSVAVRVSDFDNVIYTEYTD